jgi:hypothetical protein
MIIILKSRIYFLLVITTCTKCSLTCTWVMLLKNRRKVKKRLYYVAYMIFF